MKKVRIYYDREGNTLTVWFDDPKKEHVCEEVDDDVVLMKDRRGRVIPRVIGSRRHHRWALGVRGERLIPD